jgi:hypothetical protein
MHKAEPDTVRHYLALTSPAKTFDANPTTQASSAAIKKGRQSEELYVML